MTYDERVDVFADAGITQSDLDAAWDIVKNGPGRRMVTVEEYDAMWYPFSSPRTDGGRSFAHLSADMGIPQMYVTFGGVASDRVPIYKMSVAADATAGEPKRVLPILAEHLARKETLQQCRFLAGGIGRSGHSLTIDGQPSPADVAKIEDLIKHHYGDFVDQVLVGSPDRLIELGLNDGDRIAGCEIVAVDDMATRVSIYPRGLFKLMHNTRFEFEATSPKSVVTARMNHGGFGQTSKIETPALYLLSEWVSLTLADDIAVFGVSWFVPKQYASEMERALDEASNLGTAATLYEEARQFWGRHFHGMTVTDLLHKGRDAGSMEQAIVDTVMESSVENKEHAAKMLMAVVTYTMGFG